MLISDGFQWPMTSYTIGKYVFDYPDSWCPGVHHANDFISGTENAPIYSIGRGIVKLVKEDIRTNDKGEKIGYGLYIVVWHKAPNGEDVYALYSHLWPGTALVKENQKVERGDQIARQDTSGGARGTPHLHFEIRHPGDKGLFDIPGCPATREEAEKYYYNPLEYISKYWWENRPRVETSLPIEAARSASTVSDSVVVQQGNLNQGQQTGVYEFVITTIDKLWDLVVSFFGSAVEVTVYRPDGSVYGVYQIEKPPYMITVYDPEPGQWGYSLRAIDVPYDGYPFAVAVGTRSSPLPDVGDIIGDNPFENIEGDIAPPTTTIATEPISPNGKNGWFVSPISVTLTATDNSSGVGLFGVYYSLDDGHTYTTYSVPFVIATEGVTKLMYYSVDKLGNFEELHVIEYRLDMTPPVVSVWTDQSEYTRVQPFIDHFSGYDPEPGSGLASLLALFNNQPVTDGQVVDLFWLPLGTYTLTATGEDNAGWVTTNSKSITLIATIPSLQQAVNRLCAENYITKQGTCTSLSQKLASALSAQQRGQNKTAVNILLAFQNELKAQKGKAVTVQAYDLLMMDSNYVIQVLGGK